MKKVFTLDSNQLQEVFPEFPSYEDAYAMAMNESYPIKNILIGTTYPFSAYRTNRPPTEKYYIFEYVLSGRGKIFLSGKWHALQAGDVYIIGKNDERLYYSDEKEPLYKLWVSFSSEYIDSMMQSYGVSSGVYAADVEKNFREIRALAEADISQREKILILAENVHKIIMAVSDFSVSKNTNLFVAIENALSESVYTKSTLDEIAESLFISKSNLIRVFKKNTGITPYQFLLDEKIRIAKALLSTTAMKVKTISDKLSFSDEHYFSHLFKEKVGMSPLKYKASKLGAEKS